MFDFVDKLRELELAGDTSARKHLEDLERWRKGNNLPQLLAFERDALKIAKDEFELLSHIEYEDLVRLWEDRKRCAHPSLVSDEEMYQPSAELARSHVRNAVTHLLQQQPAQGKAALARLQADVASPYFPEKAEEAAARLKYGPIARARESLVRNAIVLFAKTLLLEDPDPAQARRLGAAISAVVSLHRAVAEQVLKEKLSDLARRAVAEKKEGFLLRTIGLVADSWDFLEEDVRALIQGYVASLKAKDDTLLLAFALDVPALKRLVLNELPVLSASTLGALIDETGPRKEFVERAVELYAGSSSFEIANYCGTRLIIPMGPLLERSHVQTIVRAAATNSQIRGSFQLGRVLTHLRDAGVVTAKQFGEFLTEAGLAEDYPALVSAER